MSAALPREALTFAVIRLPRGEGAGLLDPPPPPPTPFCAVVRVEARSALQRWNRCLDSSLPPPFGNTLLSTEGFVAEPPLASTPRHSVTAESLEGTCEQLTVCFFRAKGNTHHITPCNANTQIRRCPEIHQLSTKYHLAGRNTARAPC